MNLRIRKKLRVISSEQCYELSTCTAATNLIGKKNPASVDEVPPEILKEIFKCCDLSTRCKLRRVCQSWRYLVSLSEVNEIVLVDNSCMFIRNSCRRNRLRSSRRDRAVADLNDRSLCYGWYFPSSECGRDLNLSDHRRSGLLGPHVRVMVYDGSSRWVGSVSWIDLVRSIGLYCTNVEHVVLRHIGLKWSFPYVPSSSRKQWFPRGEEAPWDCRLRLTVLSSNVLIHKIETPNKVWYKMLAKVPLLKLDWTDETTDINLDRYIWPYPPAQRNWVAKYAPLLPQIYHDWAASGAEIYFCRRHHDKYDLRTADYDKMEASFLRVLAFCILREQKPGTNPPPYPFEA